MHGPADLREISGVVAAVTGAAEFAQVTVTMTIGAALAAQRKAVVDLGRLAAFAPSAFGQWRPGLALKVAKATR